MCDRDVPHARRPDLRFWPVFPIAGWGVGVVANAVDAYVVDAPTEGQIESEMERLRRR